MLPNGSCQINHLIDFHFFNKHYHTPKEREGREVGGFVLKGGSVLVLPDYGNNSNTTEIGKYHYQLRGCKLKHGNEIFTVIAQVHSHQDRGLDATPSYYTVTLMVI